MLNNIKSILILKKIIENLQKQKELKIIKYNKKLSTKLNITIKDFEEPLIKRLNKNYNLNIKNADIKELILTDRSSINKILECVCKIEFKNLDYLNINKCNQLNIRFLEKCNFPKLEVLNLRSDEISDISILSKGNFKELKQLDFLLNKISDIKILEKVNFKKLEVLGLKYNKISDINVLAKVNFKELKELYLMANKITDISVLEKVNFKK